MKEIVTFQVSVKVNGTYRMSPEYPTPEKACSMIVPFITKLQQRFTLVTIVRNVKIIKDAAQ